MDDLKRDFAELVVKKGVNIQKGQRLAISSLVECADFARLCAKAAYDAGCREVIMHWSDDVITRQKFLHADDDVFDKIDPWDVDYYNMLSEEGAAFLSIYAEDPESLSGVDPDRITRAEIARGKALEAYRKRMMRDECTWCVCSVPTKAWARKVFPELSEDEAVERLWHEILTACRVETASDQNHDGEAPQNCGGDSTKSSNGDSDKLNSGDTNQCGDDTLRNWQEHSDEIQKHVDIMNSYDFKTLKYKNAAGTDVTVELPEGHLWEGGEEKAANGVLFSANIPTEEVFTLPKRDSVNGTLVATRPLSLNGTLIEGFSFKVKDGKIVEVHADKGEQVLKDAISVDEGASYFGEVALVPYDSPISKSGVLFLNTLFDENASCHFAFGEAYPCIKGAENMSEEELKERGVNMSMTHVDFMVGSPDLSITGITHDGKEVPVFVDGNFAF